MIANHIPVEDEKDVPPRFQKRYVDAGFARTEMPGLQHASHFVANIKYRARGSVAVADDQFSPFGMNVNIGSRSELPADTA